MAGCYLLRSHIVSGFSRDSNSSPISNNLASIRDAWAPRGDVHTAECAFPDSPSRRDRIVAHPVGTRDQKCHRTIPERPASVARFLALDNKARPPGRLI